MTNYRYFFAAVLSALTLLVTSCSNLQSTENTPVTATAVPHTAAPETASNTIEAHQKAHYNTVWERIRAGYAMPHASNSTVDAQIRFYTSKKKYFYGIMQQSEPYLYFVAHEMEANGMPMELALLPFIESSYNPQASSPGNQNVGMWQFAAGTGRTLGLTQNSSYDGRRDVVASTEAAIRLLKKLYARFDNDWLLAVAAYNAGDGNIQAAIDKNRRAGKPTDFWSLPLNKTTQGYIPQLMALSKIVADPNVYDFALYPIADAPYFAKIALPSPVSLADAAQRSALDLNLVKRLNAGFKNGITHSAQPHLLVPVAAAETLTAQLSSLPTRTQPETSTSAPETLTQKETVYSVKSGDNLWSIAKAQKVSPESLAKANKLNPKSPLKLGQKIIIPSSATTKPKTQASTSEPTTNSSTPSASAAAKPLATAMTAMTATKKYTVKAGDTLGKIAAQHKVSVKQLMQWNNLKDAANLRLKQELIVQEQSSN